MGIPSPEQQLDFLQKMQRLLSEGLFVASYKFALLRALADLAVLKGNDTDAELSLGVKEIGQAFVELYWRQCSPFCARGGEALVLRQNTGKQATIVQKIAAHKATYTASLAKAKLNHADWNTLVAKVTDVVVRMPLWKLQRVGEEVVDFLYPNTEKGRTIVLRSGIAYCLRKFHGLLRNLIEGAWVNYVRTQNLPVLGQTADLTAFMFGADRASLERYRPVLLEAQNGRCFYCRRELSGETDVDHFVPWSRYSLDIGDNFVLAHAKCNAKKSDCLAAEEHLVAWTERTRQSAFTMLLTGIILMAADGEAWQVGANHLNVKTRGSLLAVPLVGRTGRNFARLGLEIPERLPKAPPEVVAEVWPDRT